MSREDVIYHFRNQPDLVNCATTVLHSVLPHLPEARTVEAIYANTYSLLDLLQMFELEFLREGIFTAHEFLDERSPSLFFKQAVHRSRHGSGPAFLGGVMLRKVDQNRHVISVLNIHEGRHAKATIVDTDPYLAFQHYYHRVPLQWLDRQIERQRFDFDPTPKAAVIYGWNVDELNLSMSDGSPYNRDLHFADLYKYREELIQREYDDTAS